MDNSLVDERARDGKRAGALGHAAVSVLLFALTAASAGVSASAAPEARAAESEQLFRFEFTPADSTVAAQVEADVAAGRRTIETYFGMPFLDSVRIEIHPTRAAFTASFPPEWGMAETACWMVAAGVADRLIVLSPRAWQEEACEHDPNDAQHVRDIVVHELVHVFHGQRNPTRDFTGAEEVGWFAEGLAVHVSGQLHRGRLAEPREAIEKGAAPARLADAWSGKYRYGVSGSLVAYVEATFGRDAIRELLAVTHQSQLLEITGKSESELLAGWQRFVLSAPTR